MKAARLFAVMLGIVGLALMLGTVGLCLTSLDAPVKLQEVPREAVACAEELRQALDEGNLTAVEEKLYGQPSLGVEEALTEEAAAVWELFRTGISCELTSDLYVSGSALAVDAVVTVPEIASITDTLQDHALTLMNQRIASATEMSELYDEGNNFRVELIEEVMAQAVETAFKEPPEMLTYETTWLLVFREGQWWAVPDQALMKALSGGLA